MDEPRENKNTYKIALIVCGALLVIAGLAVTFLLLKPDDTSKPRQNSSESTLSTLQKAQSQIDFPAYYPQDLPEEFNLDTNSVNTQGGILIFSYSYSGGKMLNVTQQPKPPIMESVNKTKEFDVPAGKAYLADLEGKNTGFIVTDETLIILSNAGKDDNDKLEQIMRGMKKL
jgi:flagellar basal body-associated protein FliL